MTDGSITVILPTVDGAFELDDEERQVLSLFVPGRVLSSGQIVESSGFGKDKVLRVLRRLSGKNLVRVQGSGRATRYIRA